MEFLFSIAGLIFALISLPWLVGPINRVVQHIYNNWINLRCGKSQMSAVKAIKAGTRNSYKSDFFIYSWKHHVAVDPSGNTESAIECTLVNKANRNLSQIEFPVYFDSHQEVPNGWMKIGKVAHKLFPEEYDQKTATGLFVIRFPTPLEPGKNIRFRWGYSYPKAYSEGNDWWEWYFARPHAEFSITFVFSELWSITNVSACIEGENTFYQQPRVHTRGFKWTIKAPSIGRKCRLTFDLAKYGLTSRCT